MSVQSLHPFRPFSLAAVMLACLGLHGTALADKTNLALGQPTVVSSLESGGNYQANDGKINTRWGSRFTDNEWYYVDLGSPQAFNKVIIRWQLSYGKAYKIQISDDAATWKDVLDLTDQKGGVAILTFPAVTARYVKMQGVARSNIYGFSFFEFEVYNSDNADDPGPGPEVARGQSSTARPTPTAPPVQRVTSISLGTTPAAPTPTAPDATPAAPEVPVTPKPEITSASSGSGTVGKPFNYIIVATNIPTHYGATGLPKGLTLNTGTGQIFGIPTAAGDTKVGLSATNAGGSGSITFSLTIQPPYIPPSVALKHLATASSEGLHPASHGNDGDLKTRWTATDGTFPQSWQVDLGSSKSITKVDIAWQSSGSRIYKYKIDTSSDGSNFNTKVDKTSNTVTGDTSDSFPAVTTRYIRITITSSSAGFASINEVKAY